MTEEEEYLSLVTKLAKKYTSNESTSISYEKAAQLMEAIQYCVNEYETTGGTGLAKDAPTLEEIYEAGLKLVISKTKKTREIHEMLLENFSSYGNIAYEETVNDGMQKFFLYYDAKFAPMDQMLTLDYPVLNDLESLSGIDRIAAYLQDICMEQELLAKLPYDYVINVLKSYEKDYEELIINVPEVVLMNLIGALVFMKNPMDYGYQASDYDMMYEKLNKLEDKESYFRRLFEILYERIQLSKQAEEYFKPVEEGLLVRVKEALRYHHLEQVFLI